MTSTSMKGEVTEKLSLRLTNLAIAVQLASHECEVEGTPDYVIEYLDATASDLFDKAMKVDQDGP